MLIMRHWRCAANDCNNRNGYCFIINDQHLRIDPLAIKQWAMAICNTEATVVNPPWTIKKHLMPTSKEPKKKVDIMARFDDLMERSFQMQSIQMAQKVQEQMASMTSATPTPTQYQAPYAPPAPPVIIMPPTAPNVAPTPPPPTPPPPSQPAAASGPAPTQGQDPPPLPALAEGSSHLHTTPEALISSPIASDAEDDDVLELFFDWMISSISNTDKQTRWEKARAVAKVQDWTIDDIKQMEDSSLQV